MKFLTLIQMFSIVVILLLYGCGGGEGGGEGGDSAGRTVLAFPDGLPATGQILLAGTDALFEITGLSPGAIYSITISDHSTWIEMSVYSDSGFSNPLCDLMVNVCVATPTSTSMFIKVHAFDNSADTFTLNVSPGSITTPFVFGTPDLPASGLTIGPSATILYEVTGLSPGTSYLISFNGTDGVDMLVFENDFITNLCYEDRSGSGVESCIFIPAGNSIVIAVNDSSGTGDTFSMDVAVTNTIIIAAGTDLPYTGSVDTTETLIKVTGLAEFSPATVDLTGLSDDAILRVWSDAQHAFFLCSSNLPGISDESCAVSVSSGGILFIQIDGSLTSAGTPFTLDVAGISLITLAYPTDLPTSGQTVAPFGNTYFKISGIANGTSYTVTTSGATNNIDLYVYGEFGFANLMCTQTTLSGNETCNVTANGPQLHIQVVDVSGSGDTFTLNVTTP